MTNETIPPYPQQLKVFLSQAECDHLDEKASEKTDYKEGLPQKTKNILVKEIHIRLQMIEESFADLKLNLQNSFTDSGLPKAPLCILVSVLDISIKSICKLKRNGMLLLGDLYREKLTIDILDNKYDLKKYGKSYFNKSLSQIGLPAHCSNREDISEILNIIMANKWKVLQFGSDEAGERKALTLPDILIYRFCDDEYRSRLDEYEVHILETVVWGNMRPDDAVKAIGIPGVGFLPHHIRLAGSKLIRN